MRDTNIAEIWGAVVAAVGVAANLYGANKQSKDNAHAQDVNQQAQTQQNDAAWSNYLMSRGIAPTSPVHAGTLPSAGGFTPINQRLPMWANVNPPANGGGALSTPQPSTTPLFVKRSG